MKTKRGLRGIVVGGMLFVGVLALSTNYRVSKASSVVIVDEYYELNSAIVEASETSSASNPTTVKLAQGTYDISTPIYLHSNVNLDLEGVVLRYTASSNNMVQMDRTKVNVKGYTGVSNVKISGGTFVGNDSITQTMVRIAHGKNIEFNGSVFEGGGCAHQMEIAAIDGLTLKNCEFKDANPITNEKAEAVQFDVPASTYVFGGIELDGTPMKNVSITGCTFKNVKRGVGTHSMIVGYYHRNIDISNNVFENVDGECIAALNYVNCTISGNKIKKCGGGILVQSFKKDAKAVYNTIYDGAQNVNGTIVRDMKTVVSNNNISLIKNSEADEAVGIKVYGLNLTKDTKATGKGSNDLIKKNNYYAQNVTIKNNTITTWGHGIHLMDARKCKITGNKISFSNAGSNSDGIMAEFASKDNTISSNTITKAPRFGIMLQNSTSAKSITSNTIKSPKKRGIQLYNKSTVKSSISKNKISSAKEFGIIILSATNKFSVSQNTITKCKKPIYIDPSCKKKVSVKKNKTK